MDHFAFIKEQVRQKLLRSTVCSKHVKDASSFILTLAEHSENIAKLWFELFQHADSPNFQLALLYVANEVLIKCTKYGVPEFKDVFRPFVTDAIKYLRPASLVPKLTKLFNYWLRYKLFDAKFVQQLLNDLSNTSDHWAGARGATDRPVDPEEAIKTFQPEKLVASLQALKTIEDELKVCPKLDLSCLCVDLPIANIVSSLKSKNESRALSFQVDLCCRNLEALIKKQTERLAQLNTLNELLKAAEAYYETQHKEVAVVVNAYSTYGKRVSKTLSKARSVVDEPLQQPDALKLETVVTPATEPELSPLLASNHMETDFVDDFVDDGDDVSDFESEPMAAPSGLSTTVYQPSPILLPKESDNPDAAIKSPAACLQKPVEPSRPSLKVNPLSDVLPSNLDAFALDQIRDESGDIDYRILLNPLRKSVDPPVSPKSSHYPSTTLFERGDPNDKTRQSNHIANLSAKCSTPTSSLQSTTSVCIDEDGDSMEMSDEDEPGEPKVEGSDDLSSGPLDPSAVETGDRDWRLLHVSLPKGTDSVCVISDEKRDLPSTRPVTSTVPTIPSHSPGPLVHSPVPVLLPSPLSIPPPPPPPSFAPLVASLQTTTHPVSVRSSSMSIRQTYPQSHAPPPPPPPLPHVSPVISHLLPGPRLPGGIIPSFPQPHVDMCLQFPRSTNNDATPGINSSASNVPEHITSVTSIPSSPPLNCTKDVDIRTEIRRPISASDLPEVSQINYTPAPESVTTSVASANVVPEKAVTEDPFAVISRLTGLSNLVKSLGTKSGFNDKPNLDSNRWPKSNVEATVIGRHSELDERTPNPTPTICISRVLESFGLMPVSRADLQSISTKPTVDESVEQSDRTASSDDDYEPEQKVAKPDSEEISFSDDVEVIESFNQATEDSESQGGETPTQDERCIDHADVNLTPLFPAVNLAGFLLPPSTDPSLMNLPTALSSLGGGVGDVSLTTNTTSSASSVTAVSLSQSQSVPSTFTGPQSLTSFSMSTSWMQNPTPVTTNSLPRSLQMSTGLPLFTGPRDHSGMSLPVVPPPPPPPPPPGLRNVQQQQQQQQQQMFLLQSQQVSLGRFNASSSTWPSLSTSHPPPSTFMSIPPPSQIPTNLMRMFSHPSAIHQINPQHPQS